MNTSMTSATARTQTAVSATNKAVRNTYMMGMPDAWEQQVVLRFSA